MDAKRIAVFSIKGGEGKTALSLLLALQLDYGVITNEVYSNLDSVLGKRVKKIKATDDFPKVPKDWPVIYDLRGSADPKTTNVLKEVDFIIVPITNTDEIRQGLATIIEVEPYNKNIIIVANKLEKGDYATIMTAIKKNLPNCNYPVFQMKKTAMFKRLYKEKTSITDFLDSVENKLPTLKGKKNPLASQWYKEPLRQFGELVDYLKLQ